MLSILFVAIRRATSRVEHLESSEKAALSVVGGGGWFTMWWPWGATWPFVRLDQLSWGIRVGPNYRWLGWLLLTTDMTWTEILIARRTRFTIRFTPRSAPRHWVSFGYLGYSVDPRLAAALREHGVTYRD